MHDGSSNLVNPRPGIKPVACGLVLTAWIRQPGKLGWNGDR
jgi:hypothetical protein